LEVKEGAIKMTGQSGRYWEHCDGLESALIQGSSSLETSIAHGRDLIAQRRLLVDNNSVEYLRDASRKEVGLFSEQKQSLDSLITMETRENMEMYIPSTCRRWRGIGDYDRLRITIDTI